MNIRYDYDDKKKRLLAVYLQDEELTGLISRHLHFSHARCADIIQDPYWDDLANNILWGDYSKSQMNSGSVKGAVLLDRPMLLFSIDNDSLCVLLNSIIP
jgi:hypothetical protein